MGQHRRQGCHEPRRDHSGRSARDTPRPGEDDEESEKEEGEVAGPRKREVPQIVAIAPEQLIAARDAIALGLRIPGVDGE
jgi:hypothetical protein